MNNSFSVLRDDSLTDDSYDYGPWVPNNTRYLDINLCDRLCDEISDLYEWIQPTEFEKQLRFLVIKRFINVIETFFKGSVVVPQGSSSTNTFLPISDIDLIILNPPPNLNIIEVLQIISKLFLKAKMISNFKIIEHANVPIVKLTERPFGFDIDICVSNINGALNIPRVRKILSIHPNFKPILLFFKLFIYANSIDDPANGGFGSNQIMNFVLFGFQSRPDLASNLGQMILYLLDIFANEINFFLVGISTVNGGCLFSKIKNEVLSANCPHAFVCEDPQFRDNFIGLRTSHSFDFSRLCRTALYSMSHSKFERISPLTSFLPNLDELITRRAEFQKFSQVFTQSLYAFSRITDEIPTYIPRGKHQIPPFMQREKEIGVYDPKKSGNMKMKKKHKNEMKKQQMLMNKIQILRAQEEKNMKAKKKQQKQMHRPPTPPRFRR